MHTHQVQIQVNALWCCVMHCPAAELNLIQRDVGGTMTQLSYFIPGCITLENLAKGLFKSAHSLPKSPKAMYRGCLRPAGLILAPAGISWVAACFCATLFRCRLWGWHQGKKGFQKGSPKYHQPSPLPASSINFFSLYLFYMEMDCLGQRAQRQAAEERKERSCGLRQSPKQD